MNTHLSIVRHRVMVVAFLLVAVLGLAGLAVAQEQGAHERIYAVTHVDTVPGSNSAPKILQQYVVETRKDKGSVRIELYVQIGRTNHFTLVEVWENQQAFDAHEAAAHTKQFRDQIQPMLGSPFDERLHQIVE